MCAGPTAGCEKTSISTEGAIACYQSSSIVHLPHSSQLVLGIMPEDAQLLQAASTQQAMFWMVGGGWAAAKAARPIMAVIMDMVKRMMLLVKELGYVCCSSPKRQVGSLVMAGWIAGR